MCKHVLALVAKMDKRITNAYSKHTIKLVSYYYNSNKRQTITSLIQANMLMHKIFKFNYNLSISTLKLLTHHQHDDKHVLPNDQTPSRNVTLRYQIEMKLYCLAGPGWILFC